MAASAPQREAEWYLYIIKLRRDRIKNRSREEANLKLAIMEAKPLLYLKISNLIKQKVRH
jgi:hypothetical protein